MEATTGEIKLEIDERRSMLSVEWKIWNFFGLSAEMDREVRSPTFTFMNATWYIVVYLNGQTCFSSVGWMAMYLTKIPSQPLKENVTFYLGIREEDEDFASRKFKHKFVENEIGWGESNFIQRSDLLMDRSRIDQDNSVTLFCRIYSSVRERTHAASKTTEAASKTASDVKSRATQAQPQTIEATSQTTQAVSHTTEAASQTTLALSHTTEVASQTTQALSHTTETAFQTAKSTSQTTHSESSEKLSQAFLDLLLNSEDGDVVLKVNDEEFKVHRTILKARSPVFRAMFGHGMQEANSGVVDIIDCNPVAFRDFIHYLYSGKVEEFSVSKVFDLYVIADMYDVAELKAKCVAFVMDNMSVDTFFDAITLALRHSELKLLKLATNFFMDKTSEIIMTAGWLSFVKENHVEANELYIKAFKLKNSK